jgi:large subunit ribosomal protein L3
MGHRKYSAPRRGSMAYRPRARARSLESRVRTWPNHSSEKPTLRGFAGFKVSNLGVLTIDDREKTPNFGKNLLNHSTLIAVPPIRIIGIRGYNENTYGTRAVFDYFVRDMDKDLGKKLKQKQKNNKENTPEEIKSKLDKVSRIVAVVAVSPNEISISQKKPYIWEMPLTGEDKLSQFDYVTSKLGKEVRITEVFQPGQYIDVSGITRGKGIEGPITRFGVKRKQHKSRKSVRALGTLGPISPAVVTYTVPRQGQRGFHQRIEYNKRIMIMSSVEKDVENKLNKDSGYDHFGKLSGDYIIVRGSVPGVPKRLVKMRFPIRPKHNKVVAPKILETIA